MKKDAHAVRTLTLKTTLSGTVAEIFSYEMEWIMPAETKTSKKTMAIAALIVVNVLLLAVAGAWMIKKRMVGQGGFDKNPLVKNLVFTRKEFPEATGIAREAFVLNNWHQGVGSEWWYFNAHMIDERGRRYTVMITFLNTNFVYGIISDIDSEQAFKINNAVPISIDPVDRTLTAGIFSFKQPDPRYFCYRFDTEVPGSALSLELCANKEPLRVGGKGQIPMGQNGKSYYFSLTNMTVQGTGTFGNHPIRLKGKGWLDRQWGNWSVEDFDKWRWFSIQLNDNTEIMIFNFMLKGRPVSPLCDIVPPEGEREHNLRYIIETTDNWISPRTNVSWSAAWEIKFPTKNMVLRITPDFADQEVTDALWEGGCRVEGEVDGKPVYGRAFYEERRRTFEDHKRALKKQGVTF